MFSCQYDCFFKLTCDQEGKHQVVNWNHCLALIHGRSTTSRLLRQTVIIDPRQIKSVVTSPAIWILEALFRFSERIALQKKMKFEPDEARWLTRLELFNTQPFKGDEHQWLHTLQQHTMSSVWASEHCDHFVKMKSNKLRKNVFFFVWYVWKIPWSL